MRSGIINAPFPHDLRKNFMAKKKRKKKEKQRMRSATTLLPSFSVPNESISTLRYHLRPYRKTRRLK